MYWARYVLVDQALRGGGMRSTECPSGCVWVHYYIKIIARLINLFGNAFFPTIGVTKTQQKWILEKLSRAVKFSTVQGLLCLTGMAPT